MSNHIFRQYLSCRNFSGKTSRRSDLLKLFEGLKVVPIHDELVRVGPDRDGEYLVPDVFDGVDYCFSPGVADCSEFELHWQTVASFYGRSIGPKPICCSSKF